MTRPAQMSRPWSVNTAMVWLEGQHRHPSKSYAGLCAHLFSRAFGFDGAGQNANQWANMIPRSMRHYSGVPPKGAGCFWPQGPFGHVAMSYGKNRVICNDARGGVSVIPISWYWGGIKAGGGFWVHPRDLAKLSPVFRRCFGSNPGGMPHIQKPTNAVVARPGKRSAVVPELRRIFGGKSNSTLYGMILKRKVIRWEKTHGDPTPNGVVRQHQLDRMRARK